MPKELPAQERFDREFLGIRWRLIDLAATLDRIDRGAGQLGTTPRREQIRRSLEVLLGEGPDRAAEIQRIFSLPYQENWRKEYGLEAGSGD